MLNETCQLAVNVQNILQAIFYTSSRLLLSGKHFNTALAYSVGVFDILKRRCKPTNRIFSITSLVFVNCNTQSQFALAVDAHTSADMQHIGICYVCHKCIYKYTCIGGLMRQTLALKMEYFLFTHTSICCGIQFQHTTVCCLFKCNVYQHESDRAAD